jgi:DNA-binding MarR family transcriptional regulator
VGVPSEKAGPGVSPTEVAEALHQALWASRTHSSRAVEAAGITPAQARLMWLLHGYGELRLGRLAELEGVTQANLTEIMKRLERDGLAVRTRHPDDRRVTLVRLTPEGTRRTVRARQGFEASMSDLLGGLPQEDLAAMMRVLGVMRERAEKYNLPE